MRVKFRFLLSRTMSAALLLTSGCGPGTSPSGPATTAGGQELASPQALFEEWKALVANPQQNLDGARHVMIALELSGRAPEMLHGMLDVLTDPASSPESRMMVLRSMEVAATPAIVDRLLELTKPDVDPVIRSSVIVVLGNQIDPSVVPKIDARLKELVMDPDLRIQFAALNALTMQGHDDARDQLRQFYFRENLPTAYKERILQTLSAGTRPEDAKVLVAAVADSTLQPTLRMAAVAGLSTAGDDAALPALEACAADANNPDLSAMAQDAIRAIQDRATGSGESGG